MRTIASIASVAAAASIPSVVIAEAVAEKDAVEKSVEEVEKLEAVAESKEAADAEKPASVEEKIASEESEDSKDDKEVSEDSKDEDSKKETEEKKEEDKKPDPAEEYLKADQPNVKVVKTVEEFDNYVKSEGEYAPDASKEGLDARAHDYTLVKFFAPWCPHCKEMAPKFSEAADKMHATSTEEKSDKFARVIKVDATVEEAKALGDRYQLTGYPTVILVNKAGEKVAEFRDRIEDIELTPEEAADAKLELSAEIAALHAEIEAEEKKEAEEKAEKAKKEAEKKEAEKKEGDDEKKDAAEVAESEEKKSEEESEEKAVEKKEKRVKPLGVKVNSMLHWVRVTSRQQLVENESVEKHTALLTEEKIDSYEKKKQESSSLGDKHEHAKTAPTERHHTRGVYVFRVKGDADSEDAIAVRKMADDIANGPSRRFGKMIFVAGDEGLKEGDKRAVVEVHRGQDEVAEKVFEFGEEKEKDASASLKTEKKDVLSWMDTERTPHFGEITEMNHDIYTEVASQGLLWVCLDPNNLQKEVEKYGAIFKALSAERKEAFNLLTESQKSTKSTDSSDSAAVAAEKDSEKKEGEEEKKEKELTEEEKEAEKKKAGERKEAHPFPIVYLNAHILEEHAREELGCTEYPTVVLQRGNLLADPKSEEGKVHKFIRVFKGENEDKIAEKDEDKKDSEEEKKAEKPELTLESLRSFFADIKSGDLEEVYVPDELDALDDEEEPKMDGMPGGMPGMPGGMPGGGDFNMEEMMKSLGDMKGMEGMGDLLKKLGAGGAGGAGGEGGPGGDLNMEELLKNLGGMEGLLGKGAGKGGDGDLDMDELMKGMGGMGALGGEGDLDMDAGEGDDEDPLGAGGDVEGQEEL